MKQHRPQQPKKAHTLYTPKARVVSLSSAAWQRLRAQVLAEEPLCRWCLLLGYYVGSTDVDHINNNGDDNRRENLAGMCHECHSRKTAAEMGKRVSYGCDVNGLPLDPNHHWQKITSNQATKDRPLSHARKAATSEFPE